MAGSPKKRARREGKLPLAPPSSRARGAKLAEPPDYPPRTQGETARQYLDRIGIDTICAMIRSGMMLREIGRTLGITSQSRLHDWIYADPSRIAAESEALAHAARAWDEMAVESIQSLPDDAQAGAIARARELANHLRWRAAKLGRAVYGERVQQEISGPGGGPVEVVARPVLSREEWLRAHGITVDNGPRDGSAGDTPGGDDPAPAVPKMEQFNKKTK